MQTATASWMPPDSNARVTASKPRQERSVALEKGHCESSRASFMLPVGVNVPVEGLQRLSGGGDARGTCATATNTSPFSRSTAPYPARATVALAVALHWPVEVFSASPVLWHLEVHVARQRAAGCFHLDLAGRRATRYGGRDFCA